MPPARIARTTSAGSKPNGAQHAILSAARAEFAAKGLTGARVNEIARRAGVNKQLIYYYYGNKEELYRTALEAVYVEIRALERALDLGALPPDEAMAALVEFSFDYLAQHPDFIGLLSHENAHGAHHARSSRAIRRTNSPLIDLIAATLQRGVAANVFRSGIDPLELYISVAGMTYFYFSNRLTLSAIFGRNLSAPKTAMAYRRHVVTFAVAGLRR